MQRMNMEGYGKLGILDSEITQNNSLKYYCMSCGTQHKGIECPKCGSKAVRTGESNTDVGSYVSPLLLRFLLMEGFTGNGIRTI